MERVCLYGTNWTNTWPACCLCLRIDDTTDPQHDNIRDTTIWLPNSHTPDSYPSLVFKIISSAENNQKFSYLTHYVSNPFKILLKDFTLDENFSPLKCTHFYRQLHFRSKPQNCLTNFENGFETKLTLPAKICLNDSSFVIALGYRLFHMRRNRKWNRLQVTGITGLDPCMWQFQKFGTFTEVQLGCSF